MSRNARNNDPPESHGAAEWMDGEGHKARMMALALELVRTFPGKTSNELEALSGFTDGKIRKRLNDLYHDGKLRKGPVRPSTVTGRPNATWYVADAEGVAA
jgi:hypothetical protein